MKHQGTIVINTDRLILRRFTKEDAEPCFNNWTNDNLTTKYLSWQVHKTIDVTINILNKWIESYNKKDFYQWAIVLKDTMEVIGSISVVGINEKVNEVSIGYCIGSAYWYNGYTPEAFKAIIAFLFNEVDVNRIEARHAVDNPNSGKVMKKCGLKYEGTLKQSGINNQGLADLCVYAILKQDYLNNCH